MRQNRVAWAALVVSAAALIGSQNWHRTVPAGPQLPQEGLAEAKRLSAAFEAVAEYVGPSVVQISVQRAPEPRRGGGEGGPPGGMNPREMTPEQLEEFFRRFFPDGPGGGLPEEFFRFEPQQFQVEGTGSGFLYDEQGHILTNNHVVEGADGDGDIRVSFSDGSSADATVVGTDPATDVAVIKVDPKALEAEPRPIRVGSSDELHVGQWVLAVGSPFGLSQTVTAGIISATNRNAVGILDRDGYEDFIQTDAAINPGNSGGPLVDIEGRVIGINSAIATRTRANAGVGFAIPIKLASYVADSIIQDGKVRRAVMGVQISPLLPELAEQFGIDPEIDGILVNEVFPGTPAAEAGLEPGDVIVGFKGREVDSVPDFRLDVSTSPLDQDLELSYIREGERKTATINLAPAEEVEMPSFARAPDRTRPQEAPRVELDRFGLALQDLSPELAEQFGHEEGTTGVLVRSVEPGSPAFAEGIQAGDLITKVIKDKKPQDVTDLESFGQLAGDSGDLAVYVQPPSEPGRFVVLKPGSGESPEDD
ncbi:trypsin-like peptidase domain-containing protein [Tautonia plasticadhaerens]|uniref:Putative periplasmic serine endoprotease DegP-like n=1 Tax=Tautonia plasticadhaerens TaxID=2527974 RepID=A0A518H4Y0_9BACT|nr:trypsin-like peptidase domain-containing protein [Tautonia plasticadhaerens]QDV35892.1 putative periplasmic serine endoprotease DegP-like precursor [Tautonia plasticadhaerens]